MDGVARDSNRGYCSWIFLEVSLKRLSPTAVHRIHFISDQSGLNRNALLLVVQN
jgi:hypothetical protein